jgi:hypothetical protein
MLLYGAKRCRFCGEDIAEDYAQESSKYTTFVTYACKSANQIHSLRPALLIPVAWGVWTYFSNNPSFTALIVSLLMCIAPIRWLGSYGRVRLQDAEFIQAQKKIRVVLYLSLGAIVVEAIALLISLWKR